MQKKKEYLAVQILKSGGVIAFPTETVFGIGALLDKPEAIQRIFEIKKRPKDKPLQILVADLERAKQLGQFSQKAEEFAKKHWPGPFTLVVYKKDTVPQLVTGGSDKVGLRVPDHKIALELIKKCGPIVATSANRSGEKPALTAKEVKEKLPEVDYVLAGKTKSGQASKVIDLSQGTKVLRA
ncbi:L-threonylcarbamoyladenylate synthase [Candidatus Margulisiibacteriota bacterium]